MALHEAGDCIVRGAVLNQQEGQGRASETSRKGLAVTHSYVEVGGDHYELHHEVTKDNEGVWMPYGLSWTD